MFKWAPLEVQQELLESATLIGVLQINCLNVKLGSEGKKIRFLHYMAKMCVLNISFQNHGH